MGECTCGKKGAVVSTCMPWVVASERFWGGECTPQ